jgi:hypothetical protein
MDELNQMYAELKNFAHKFYDYNCSLAKCEECPFNKVIAVDVDGCDVDICDTLVKML